MAYITGVIKEQKVLFPASLDEYIDDDSMVRAVAAFIEHLPIGEMGFLRGEESETKGRPGYDPRVMLGIFVWGHLNNVRSSRRIERECGRNVELMWLSGMLRPDFKTLCRFRVGNAEAIGEVLTRFRMWCDEVGLIGKQVVAIDGSKFNAVNSIERNVTEAKLTKRIAREKANVERYLKELEATDAMDEGDEIKPTAEELKAKIATIGEYIGKQEERLEKMKEDGVTQISETDAESRLMKTAKGTKMAYNVQAVVDERHKLIVGVKVTSDVSDRTLLTEMALQTKKDLGVDELTVIADGGYYACEAIKECEEENITTYVPITETEKDEQESGIYKRERFSYDAGRDVYVCPWGEEMTKVGTTSHQVKGKKKLSVVYATAACGACPLREKCTKAKGGRRLKRWIHEDVTERLRKRLEANPEMFRKRKGLVEHPFGTIKVGMGHERLLMKGKVNVGTEISLTVLGYNLKRVMSILGIERLIDLLKTPKMAFQTV